MFYFAYMLTGQMHIMRIFMLSNNTMNNRIYTDLLYTLVYEIKLRTYCAMACLIDRISVPYIDPIIPHHVVFTTVVHVRLF